jgi:dCMP deaminase
MRILENSEIDKAEIFFEEAKKEALKSTCYIRKCGALIVKNDIIRGRGFNSPPGNIKLEKCFKDLIPVDFKSDRNCCVHAEQRAINNALYEFIRQEINESTLYFTKLDKEENIIPVGKPDCTICSKLALDSGISKWVLLHDFGYAEYNAEEYNNISFGLREWK